MRKNTLCFYSFIICAAIAALGFGGGPAAAQSVGDVQKEFASPAAKYSGAPFWAWDEKLLAPELSLQIDELREGGMGGFFMHAREGRITPYLSKEWMDAVRISVEKAKQLGMLAYLYDEDRWPSGFAGGIVPRENPNFRQKALYMYETDKPLAAKDIDPEWQLVRVFFAKRNGNEIESYRDVTRPPGVEIPAPPEGQSLLYFFRVFAKTREWFNNTAYIDTMSPAAVRAFIDSTYEAYRKVVGDEFGKTVPAIFTDEPCFYMNGDFPQPSVPWTDNFAADFKMKNGYAVEDVLPLIFYRAGIYKRVRLDFWTTATESFREAFGHQIFDWTEKYNIKFTGHYMCEDNLSSQTRWIGAAMPHYEYMQFPGIDHLGRNIDNVMTAKQASSAAHQFGRPQILTELYGCSGWNLSFENMKWIADWHYALGVNFMNQHLSWYTMRGCRKRDYPASIHYQSPWWRYHKTIADYIRRASFINSQGAYTADALVIHPITSAWAVYSPIDESVTFEGDGTSGPIDLNGKFVSLIMLLSGRQVDYDLGDELIIARHARVDGKNFIIGEMKYTSVIIPPGVTLRESTVNLLQQFIAAGGPVVMIEPAPALVNADRQLILEGAAMAKDNDDALAKLATALTHRVLMSGEKGKPAGSIYVHQREVNGTRFIFFANTDQDNSVNADAVLPYAGRVRSWDLFTGAVEDLPAEVSGGKARVTLHFERAGSALLSVTPGEAHVAVQQPKPELVRRVDLPEKWKIVSQDPNALTIDFMSFRREGDADWTAWLPQYSVQDSLESKGAGTKFSLRYTFNIGFDPKQAKELWFVMEQAEIYDITLNGRPIKYTPDQGWWRDRYFRRIDIRGAAVQGANTLEASATFVPPKEPYTLNFVENGVEVEAAYVVGDFSVRLADEGGYTLKPAMGSIKYGNLASHGFPFFSGSIVIAQDVEIEPPAPGEKVFLELLGLEAITTLVKVNGREAGLIAFHPHRVEITPFIKPGSNSIEIELTDSNRNLMGPLHHIEKEPLSVGPGDFRQTASRTYNFIPFGITKGARIAYFK